MGNSTNHYRNIIFMMEYDHLQEIFRNQIPLFDINSIELPLSTKGMAIVDSNGRRVKLAGASWSGGHAARHCVGGLDRQPLSRLCQDIKQKFQLNCVRLTFSLELFKKNNRIDSNLISANKSLFGMTAKQIFKQTVEALTNQGLMVILNNHTSKSQWCCTLSDGDGLWFNDDYSQEHFFACLEELAFTFRNNKRVIGMDLRNQVRKSYVGKPTWGDGSKFDWKKAAETAGNRIHQIAPHWLIIVGGLNYQLDLTGIFSKPVKLKQSNKLVYSGHFYGFSWGHSLIWDVNSEEDFRERLFNQQLYVRKIQDQATPFILGEFGSNVRDKPWIYLIKYLKEMDLDWIYWCLDGYKCDNQQDQTYGIWDYQFNEARHPDILQDLKEIGRPKKGIQRL